MSGREEEEGEEEGEEGRGGGGERESQGEESVKPHAQLKILQGLITNLILLIINTAACGGTLSSPEGNITSPSYPDNYPKNKRCVWKITVPKGQRISLKFLAFQLEGTGYGVRLFTS